MKYGTDIIKIIIKGLEEIPNIRHVLKKVGVHHSTFYRWMVAYPEFRNKVLHALFRGRGNISDLATGNLIRAIKEGDLGASKFWLTHLDAQFMTSSKYDHFIVLTTRLLDSVEKGKFGEDEYFEKLFPACQVIEEAGGIEAVKEVLKAILPALSKNDEDMIELFYSSYAEWRVEDETNRKNISLLEEKVKEYGVEPHTLLTNAQNSSLDSDIEQVIKRVIKK
ncbi:MAG: hypothetical protein WCT07_00045 [Candidatus Paceibacterota bacterium]|jgi:hypothetical protein